MSITRFVDNLHLRLRHRHPTLTFDVSRHAPHQMCVELNTHVIIFDVGQTDFIDDQVFQHPNKPYVFLMFDEYVSIPLLLRAFDRHLESVPQNPVTIEWISSSS